MVTKPRMTNWLTRDGTGSVSIDMGNVMPRCKMEMMRRGQSGGKNMLVAAIASHGNTPTPMRNSRAFIR